MEARKQRIMRKYLREYSSIFQSDELVPVDVIEDEALTEAERFKQPAANLTREQRSRKPRPPRRRIPIPKERNWLLAEEPDVQEEKAARRDQSPLQNYLAPSRDSDFQRESRWYKARDEMAPARQHKGRYERFADPRDSRAQTQQGAWKTDSTGGRPGSRFGVPLDSRRAIGGVGSILPQRRTFQTPENPGSFPSPFPGLMTRDRTDEPEARDRSRGVTPYKSPYQTRRDPRAQPLSPQPGSASRFQRVDPYKEWKSRNSSRNDPTRDDAYVDELLPKFGQ